MKPEDIPTPIIDEAMQCKEEESVFRRYTRLACAAKVIERKLAMMTADKDAIYAGALARIRFLEAELAKHEPAARTTEE